MRVCFALVCTFSGGKHALLERQAFVDIDKAAVWSRVKGSSSNSTDVKFNFDAVFTEDVD